MLRSGDLGIGLDKDFVVFFHRNGQCANFDPQILSRTLAIKLDRKSLEILIPHYQYGSVPFGGALLCQKRDGVQQSFALDTIIRTPLVVPSFLMAVPM